MPPLSSNYFFLVLLSLVSFFDFLFFYLPSLQMVHIISIALDRYVTFQLICLASPDVCLTMYHIPEELPSVLIKPVIHMIYVAVEVKA